MHASVLTIVFAALCAAVRPGNDGSKSASLKRLAHFSPRQGLAGKLMKRIDRRQQDGPVVPEAGYPEFTTEAICDEYDGYLYSDDGYVFQLQCTTIYQGSNVLALTTTDNLADCIHYCITYNLQEQVPVCYGVHWNAPYVGSGDCSALSEAYDPVPANEAGGVQEAALLISDPDGAIYATPTPMIVSSTTRTPTSTATPSPSNPPLGPYDDFYIAVSVELPRVKRAIYYVEIAENGHAILISDFASASIFVVDGNGGLSSNGAIIGTSTSNGIALLQVLAEEIPTIHYWTVEGSSLTFEGTTFCATLLTTAEVYVVYPDGEPSQDCFPLAISAVSEAVPQEPGSSTTTSSPAAATSTTTTTSIFPSTTSLPSLPTSRSVPTSMTTMSPEPSFISRSSASEVFTWTANMTSTSFTSHSMTMTIPSASVPILSTTIIPSSPVSPGAQVTNFVVDPITAFEIHPWLSCAATDSCVATSTTVTKIWSRTGINCVPAFCTGLPAGFAANYQVDALFADPTCLVRPTAA